MCKMMNYIQLICKIESDNLPLSSEIVIHELASLGYESFEETTDGVTAYIPEPQFNQEAIETPAFLADYNLGTVKFSHVIIQDQNWNKEWENNFQPVNIAGKCYIRAPFHQKNEKVPYEIVMEPKMAFGTGHHETTSLMIETMFSLNFENREILDMGSGTGVLGIMASKLGAKNVLAIDIDEWAFHSTSENAAVNQVFNIKAEQGGVEKFSGKKFDMILANINRNILLDQISAYAQSLIEGGVLLMSGIYEQDFETIKNAAEKNGFVFQLKNAKNNWIVVLFNRKHELK
jgi:ribosomal protein L11 methyltransferase